MPARAKRSDQLQRPRERKGGDVQAVKHGQMREVVIPTPPEDWHPMALQLWYALLDSGQTDFFQSSDYAFALTLLDDLSVYKRTTWRDGTPRRSSDMLKAILMGLEKLLFTEGDRRKFRVELMKPEEEAEDAELILLQGMQARPGFTAAG